MQHTWLKPAVFLSIFLLFLCYIFKNSSTVKKLCGPVQKSQCEKSCKIEGAAKKCCGLLAEPSTEWLDSSWIAYSRVTPELSTGWLYSSWMVFVGDLNCLQSDLYLAECTNKREKKENRIKVEWVVNEMQYRNCAIETL